MKRDEVMAMTDEELRIKVEELLGHDLIPVNYCEDKLLVHRDGGFREIRDYPNDIAAAWELLQSVYGHRGIANIEISMTDGGECEVSFWTAMHNSTVVVQWKEGDSPKQAITRAFIRAIEENHE